MSVTPGTTQRLLAARAYKTGQISARPLTALIQDLEHKIAAGQSFPDLKEVRVTNANDTAQIAQAGAGVFYGLRVENTDGDAVSVLVSDGVDAVIIGCAVAPGQIAATATAPAIVGVGEAYTYDGAFGIGAAFATDIRVRAFKSSDGTTPADAGCTVFLLIGI